MGQDIAKQFISFYDAAQMIEQNSEMGKQAATQFLLNQIITEKRTYLYLLDGGYLQPLKLVQEYSESETQQITKADIKHYLAKDADADFVGYGMAIKPFAFDLVDKYDFCLDQNYLRALQSPADYALCDDDLRANYQQLHREERVTLKHLQTIHQMLAEMREAQDEIKGINEEKDRLNEKRIKEFQTALGASKAIEVMARQFAKENEQLKQANAEQAEALTAASARIAELEAQLQTAQTSGTPASFDESDKATYPPELAKAWQIWQFIYQENRVPRHFNTHADKFRYAIKTLGITTTGNAEFERLSKITTPQLRKGK